MVPDYDSRMARHRRLEHNRFVGIRDTMRVYDTDDPMEAQALLDRLEADDLLDRNLVSTFGPDSVEEAENRGFKRPRP